MRGFLGAREYHIDVNPIHSVKCSSVMTQAGGMMRWPTSVLFSHEFSVLTAAELKTPGKIAQWATDAIAYNSNPDFAKLQPILTRGLGPGVGYK